MSTHARPLAAQLAAADDASLRTLLALRGIRSDVRWKDFFDAAEALLDPPSIARALRALPRPEAEALHAAVHCGTPIDRNLQERLIARALLVSGEAATGAPGDAPAPDAQVPEEVAREVRSLDLPVPPPVAAAPVADPPAAAHAAERAFTTTTALAELLLLARAEPLALRAGGEANSAERRRLGDAGLDLTHLDDLLALAQAADLVRLIDRTVRATPAAEGWLRRTAPERWAVLAAAFRESLPEGLRTAAGASPGGTRGWLPLGAWPAQYPWDPEWPAQAAALRDRAGLLGLDAEGAEPAWAVPLRTGEEVEPGALRAALPAEVDRLFLQNDLTAIAPGPLAPVLDMRLRTIANRESAAQAGLYRFSAESLDRGLLGEETAETIRAFLTGISLTGLPQPLDYLLTQAAERHGRIHVRLDPATGLTRVETDDAALRRVLEVDQALRPLGLTRGADDALLTAASPATAAELLRDARHPAIVGDAGRPGASSPASADLLETDGSDHRPLIARLRDAHGADAEAAWLDRALAAAVRVKAAVRVEIELRDGSSRILVLEATGLGGGRLRGLDRAADVERTLPVRSIRSIDVLPAAD